MINVVWSISLRKSETIGFQTPPFWSEMSEAILFPIICLIHSNPIVIYIYNIIYIYYILYIYYIIYILYIYIYIYIILYIIYYILYIIYYILYILYIIYYIYYIYIYIYTYIYIYIYIYICGDIYITIVIGCCWASIFPNLWGVFPPQLQPRSILRMRNFQRVNAMVEQAKAAKVRKQIRAISPNIRNHG